MTEVLRGLKSRRSPFESLRRAVRGWQEAAEVLESDQNDLYDLKQRAAGMNNTSVRGTVGGTEYQVDTITGSKIISDGITKARVERTPVRRITPVV